MKALDAGLRGRLRGSAHLDRTAIDRWCRDFGGYRMGQPDYVVEAVCEEDVATVLGECRAQGIPVTLRGSGHSSNGLSVARGGMLLVNRPAPKSEAPILGDIADIEARARWDTVERALNSSGRSSPVLTNTLDLSVGGTVSVAGFGVRSARWGAQVDNVESLRLVLPTGEALDASRSERPELFHMSLAGLGAIAFIERVRFRTVNLPRCSQAYVNQLRSWDALIALLGEIAELPTDDGLRGQPAELVAALKPNGTAELHERFYLESSARGPSSADLPPRLHRAVRREPEVRAAFTESRATDAWIAGFGATKKVWGDYVLDYPAFVEFVQEAWRRVSGGHPGHRYLPWVYILMLKTSNPAGTDGFWPGSGMFSPTVGATGSFRFGCGFYHMVPEVDAVGVQDALRACQELSDLCVQLGGKPYLHGVSAMDEQTRGRVYGPAYARLKALRAELDPDGLFNAGWFANAE